MQKKLAGILLVLFIILGCSRNPESDINNPAHQIDRFENGFPQLTAKGILLGQTTTLSERMQQYHVPGVSIAVIDNYEVVWAKGYGVLDAESNEPVTTDSLFPFASIGKALTAVAVMDIVDAGFVDLDQDVNELLISWELPGNEFTAQEAVTLRRLLSHTAGVSVIGFRGFLQDENLPTLLQVLEGEPPANNAPIRVESMPGTHWAYSGGGYQVVEQIMIDVTGQSFPAIMQESILQPAQMASTIYTAQLPEALLENTAAAHGRWGQPIPGKWLNTPYLGAGGGFTTPTDLAQFASLIMQSYAGQSSAILPQDLTRLMLTPVAEDIPFMGPLSMDWGLGWQLNTIGGQQFISHGGDFPEGYQNLLVTLPEQGWGAVIMTNGANGDALRLEILYTLALVYGIFPPLRQLVLFACLLFLLLSLIAVLVVVFVIRRVRRRQSTSAEIKNNTKSTQHLLVPVILTILAASIVFYIGLTVILGFMKGPTQVSALQAKALGTVEQGEILAEHGKIAQAMALYSDAVKLAPDIAISASTWNHLCIRGCVWGQVADVMDYCNLAVTLAPDDDGMLFGRGLARALTDDFAGAITDFDLYVHWTKVNGFYDPYGIEIEAFIVELELGRNPFDEEQLEKWK